MKLEGLEISTPGGNDDTKGITNGKIAVDADHMPPYVSYLAHKLTRISSRCKDSKDGSRH